MRFLLAAHPTVGHTNALRTIGRRLLQRGHAVAFATTVTKAPPRWVPFPDVMRTAAEIPTSLVADGFHLVPLQPSLWALRHAVLAPMSRGYDELRHAVGMFGTTMVSDARTLAAAIDAFGADVVVGDFLLFGAFLAAKLQDRPFAAFFHSALPFPAPGRAPFGSGLPNDAPRDADWEAAERSLASLSALAHEKMCGACRRLGVAPPGHEVLERPYSDDLNLLATTRDLEPGLREMPANAHFVGPCLEGRDEDAGHPVFAALRGPGTRVYVSMGTVFNTNPRIFEAILRGLDRPGVRVVVSAGAAFEALSRRPPTSNAAFFPRVPQLGVLREVDVVVGHGGNNTTMETFAAGKPLVVVPFGGDQLQNARRVESLGAGVAVLPAELGPARIGAAFERALGCRERAREIGASLVGVDGTGASVRLLEGLGAAGGG